MPPAVATAVDENNGDVNVPASGQDPPTRGQRQQSAAVTVTIPSGSDFEDAVAGEEEVQTIRLRSPSLAAPMLRPKRKMLVRGDGAKAEDDDASKATSQDPEDLDEPKREQPLDDPDNISSRVVCWQSESRHSKAARFQEASAAARALADYF